MTPCGGSPPSAPMSSPRATSPRATTSRCSTRTASTSRCATGPSRRRVRAASGCCTDRRPTLAQQAPYQLVDPLDLQDSLLLDVFEREGCDDAADRQHDPQVAERRGRAGLRAEHRGQPRAPRADRGHRVHARPDERRPCAGLRLLGRGRDLVAALDRSRRPRHGRHHGRLRLAWRRPLRRDPQLHDHEPERPAHRKPVRADADDRARRPPEGGPAVGQRDDRARRQRRQGPRLRWAQRLQRPAATASVELSLRRPRRCAAGAASRRKRSSGARPRAGRPAGPPGRARRRHGLRRLPALDQAAAFRRSDLTHGRRGCPRRPPGRGATPFRDPSTARTASPACAWPRTASSASRPASDRWARSASAPTSPSRSTRELGQRLARLVRARRRRHEHRLDACTCAVDRPRPDLGRAEPAHGHQRQEPRARDQRTAGSWRSCTSSSSAPEPPRAGSRSSS